MAKSINKAILVGYLGQDPDTQYTRNDKSVTKFSLATSKSWKDKKGDWQDKTEWHNIVQWNMSEALAEALHKGSRVYVEGEITTNSWEKDGEKKYRTEIVANTVIDLGVQATKSKSSGKTSRSKRDEEEEYADDDIPF